MGTDPEGDPDTDRPGTASPWHPEGIRREHGLTRIFTDREGIRKGDLTVVWSGAVGNRGTTP